MQNNIKSPFRTKVFTGELEASKCKQSFNFPSHNLRIAYIARLILLNLTQWAYKHKSKARLASM